MSTILGIDVNDYGLQNMKCEGGSTPQTETKNVKSTTTQQTITPTSGKLIDKVIVEPIVLEQVNVTPDYGTQTITPSSGKDGISQVNVGGVTLEYKQESITGNGVYTIQPSQGYMGLEGVEVDVSVSGGGGNLQPLQTPTIEENGQYLYDPQSEGLDGYSLVEVNVNVSSSSDGSVVLDKVKYYDSYQDKQQALSNELLNIGDIGMTIENKNEVVMQDNSSQNYLAFKFEEQVYLNDIGGDPNQVNAQGSVFVPVNNNNAYFGDVSITDLFDMTQMGQDGILTIDYTYNNENYTLTAKYTYDSQTDYVIRKSVEVKNSNNEVVSSVDKNGYIFLPFKFHTGGDFWQVDIYWFFYGGLCKGMYGQMGNSSIYDGQSWGGVVNP